MEGVETESRFWMHPCVWDERKCDQVFIHLPPTNIWMVVIPWEEVREEVLAQVLCCLDAVKKVLEGTSASFFRQGEVKPCIRLLTPPQEQRDVGELCQPKWVRIALSIGQKAKSLPWPIYLGTAGCLEIRAIITWAANINPMGGKRALCISSVSFVIRSFS